jgi:N5-(cytidine 5'-diphosphoramidyl)-L-glutamine hydrolase
MKAVFVTQRITVDPAHGERCDSLDQRWIRFLRCCGLLAIPVPNTPATAVELMGSIAMSVGLILTGGGDIAACGGTDADRDETEGALIDVALSRRLPILGICRGMQVLIDRFGGSLERISGHVATEHHISLCSERSTVNSYHGFATFDAPPLFDALAVADDGVVEAIRHTNAAILGLMWHPERYDTPQPRDLKLLGSLFHGSPS